MPPSTASYQIGHKTIDAEHDRIVALWRDLEATQTMETARDVAAKLMAEALGHFAREEEFMTQCGFPRRMEHAAMHREMASNLRRIILAPLLTAEARENFVAQIRALMQTWVTIHIVVEDAKIAPFARALGNRLANSRRPLAAQ